MATVESGFSRIDVASIKKNPLGGARVSVETPAEPRIVGGPGWIGVDRFDVSATASVEGWSGERTRQMVRVLLADRFSSARTAEAPACAEAARRWLISRGRWAR